MTNTHSETEQTSTAEPASTSASVPTADRQAVSEKKGVNRVLVAASALAAATALIHVIGGGIEVWQPLADSTLADGPRLVSLAVWHMASVALAMSAVALGIGARPTLAAQSRYLVIFVSLMWVGFGLCFVGTALTEPVDNAFATLLQPTLLLPVGVLGLIGSRPMS